MSEVNWAKIREAYETTPATLADLAYDHNIKAPTVRKRASREKWKKPDELVEASRHTSPVTSRHAMQSPKRDKTSRPLDLKPGAPKGSKNALVTGQYESIFTDTLTPDERGLFLAAQTDKLEALDEQIRLGLIRERRMLQRIARLSQSDMAVVEETETLEGEEIRPVNEDAGNAVVMVHDKKSTVKKTGTLGQIQRIEEALTRVQSQVRQMLVDKHRIETGLPPDGEELDRLFANMRRSRGDVAKGGGADAD